MIFILLLILSIITLVIISNSNIENFDLLGITSKNTETKNTETKNTEIKEDQFKYFKILPEFNKWSDETRGKMKEKIKEIKGPTWDDKSVEYTISRWEEYGSEEEAKIYIETGEWPLNNYVKGNLKKYIDNTVNSNENIKEEDKEKEKEKLYNEHIDMFSGKIFNPFLSNPVSSSLFSIFTAGEVNNMVTENDMVGQSKFITKTFKSIDLPDKGKFNCGWSKDGKKRFVPYINSLQIDEENYNILEKNIPGFKFLQKPCNPCANRCPYSYEGVIAAPYARYWGISSQSGKSTPEEVN